MSHLYYILVKEILIYIHKGITLKTTPQDERLATYSLWRDDDDYNINWNETSQNIRRFIDAVGEPYLGACAILGESKVRILEAVEEENVIIENRQPGKVIFVKNDEPIVVCGDGLLRIKRIVDDEKRRDLIPLSKFRTRFK